ncbi:TetR/AcrR family transcriptional regulator [Oceanicoccus sp. KOV_DT_Chl]|uniref:TetR/AcrR family transcriptional regulator n=1 Tax=Oceanicoccus sp. KOV_DT_Chl TaxID=1904639 RepID=UPI000C7E50BB|nr:TetR/AcrR family transcriptional regulator [Oceanicoccus sp. KOV_DT_Chl]
MSAKPAKQRRSQAERRTETFQQVLDSACRLFGDQGYHSTSLEDIANDCGLTTRPIYHYFGNKKALFAAVNECMEQRILEEVYRHEHSKDVMANWRAFLKLCEDERFRRIVLLDSPNVLGRDRWQDSAVTRKAQQLFSRDNAPNHYRQQLLSRMMMAAFAEAALVIANADDTKLASQQAEFLVQELFSGV